MNTQAGLVYIICTSIFARHYFDKKLDDAFQQGLSLVVPLMLQATVAIYGRTELLYMAELSYIPLTHKVTG